MKQLFKRDSTGAVRVWWMEVECSKYRTNSGQKDGSMTTSDWTQCAEKNVGKKNFISADDQAIKEAEASYKKKIKEGYFENESDIDSGTLVKPMLAHKYGDYPISFPVACQPKLDGIRCVATKDGLFSRKGERFNSVPHIESILVPLCAEYNMILDGELYNHDYKDNFNEIQSLVMKKKPTAEDLAESADKVQYHIYDVIKETTNLFKNRDQIIADLFGDELSTHKQFVRVKTEFVPDQEVLDATYGVYLQEGYEGQMIRGVDSKYENKRSKNLLKRKEFQDAEFKIIKIEEGLGNRSGMAGAVVCQIGSSPLVFGAGIKGGVEFNKKLWDDRDNLVGQLATIRYQNLTPDGIPRFPVFHSVRKDAA